MKGVEWEQRGRRLKKMSGIFQGNVPAFLPAVWLVLGGTRQRDARRHGREAEQKGTS